MKMTSSSLRLLRACFNRLNNQQRNFFLQPSYHAPITIQMPALSPTMEEGSIVKWLVKEGDYVEVGDALCEVETDKAVVTVESSDDGTIAKILLEEGTKNIKLSVPIAMMAEEGEDVIEAGKSIPYDPTLVVAPVTSEPLSTPPQPVPVTFSTLPLSPAVRQTIEWYNIDSSLVPASGKNGRLLKGDVLKFIADNNLSKQDQTVKTTTSQQPTTAPVTQTTTTTASKSTDKPPATTTTTNQTSTGRPIKVKYEDIELTNVRKIIAQRLTESKQQIPHSYNSISCKVDQVIALRKTLKENGVKLSMNDFVVKAAGLALQQNKIINSVRNNNGEIEESMTSDISIAVATPTGLITPILKKVEGKGLQEISQETRSLAGRAREGKLKPDEFQGGSFTISNLGMFGVSHFTAVINPPQTCIMAVGTTRNQISLQSVNEDGSSNIQQENVITVTLSSDCRVVNDQEAAVFLETFKSKLEDPMQMLM